MTPAGVLESAPLLVRSAGSASSRRANTFAEPHANPGKFDAPLAYLLAQHQARASSIQETMRVCAALDRASCSLLRARSATTLATVTRLCHASAHALPVGQPPAAIVIATELRRPHRDRSTSVTPESSPIALSGAMGSLRLYRQSERHLHFFLSDSPCRPIG